MTALYICVFGLQLVGFICALAFGFATGPDYSHEVEDKILSSEGKWI